ncbi:reverse transcriptase domain-containing protein [Aeromonas hydrophila]|uniref:reverse transcriptase domain-containing protein n=1 Tax=Aeromonas hydrophila TaxID=644 RepID=UPI000332AAEC|nr:reverse transcriptase domain-containing protein [Aeromonas hydrophila]AGM42217.1 hypothetical protein AHML_02160 [Aeromonas hydrophila ML09-119]MCA4700798.1 hypothetical protein [Aeromonas hydrophila]MCO4223554.1 reverse transcriptase domain-containing protein [Aeromonas hydrophila]USJ76385.1 hypothetical protein LDP97_17450 [Aeromonas hydrophila]UUT50228.1 reverse transcriptase domain-containing protein [Aeromonas hydrophila]
MNSRYPELAPAQAWQLAYQWLCQRRRHYPANADIWHLRFHWPARSATLFARVMAGHYRLSPMQLLGGHAIWSAEDALVLKWVALRVAPRLPWHPACEHGRGMGVVASRRRLHDFLQGAGGSHPYVLRTDIRGYYQHIDRARVLSRLVAPLPCPVCRELMRQYLYYSVECGGEFHTPGGGISRGCALSPLIGASLLWHIDADFAARGELYYARYMDDFIVLARACAMPCAVSMAIWPPTALASTPPRPGLAAWIAASTGWGAGIPRRAGSASPPTPCNAIEPSPCGFMSRPCVPATRKPSANAGCGGI